MQQIINFFFRYKHTILFLLLLFVSVSLTVQSHTYHNSRFVSSANFMTGGLYDWVNNMDSYFSLKEENKRLVKENRRLRAFLRNQSKKDSTVRLVDSTEYSKPYHLVAAEVISNSYAKLNNYILLNKGRTDGVKEDFGVITSLGIMGIIESTTDHYSRVISILNSNSAINVRLKKSNHYGTLIWDGKNPNMMQLTYVPKIANIQKGDTVITGGKSFIFPEGIPVGVIHDFNLGKGESYYNINIQLFNDMTNIGHVYVIMNENKKELLKLSPEQDNE